MALRAAHRGAIPDGGEDGPYRVTFPLSRHTFRSPCAITPLARAHAVHMFTQAPALSERCRQTAARLNAGQSESRGAGLCRLDSENMAVATAPRCAGSFRSSARQGRHRRRSGDHAGQGGDPRRLRLCELLAQSGDRECLEAPRRNEGRGVPRCATCCRDFAIGWCIRPPTAAPRAGSCSPSSTRCSPTAAVPKRASRSSRPSPTPWGKAATAKLRASLRRPRRGDGSARAGRQRRRQRQARQRLA